MSEASAVRIVGLTQTGKPGTPERKRVIAFFDVAIADMLMICGVALIRGGNALTISPPRFQEDARRRVEIINGALKGEIRKLAIATYLQMGGRDVPP